MVNIDIQTFYKNKLRDSRIGIDKPDSFVSHCIMDPNETGLNYLKFNDDDNTYDIELNGLSQASTEERINYLRNIKGVSNSIPDGKDISLVSILDNTIRSYYEIPDFDDDTSPGCSKVDLSGMSVEEQEKLKFNTTNIKLKFNGTTYEILHRNKIQLLYNKIFDNPNRILVFFQVLLITVIVLFIYSIIGVCFEFWIRYGYAPRCLYYRNNCNTINKELSVIDYVFPKELCDYPYQRCNRTNKFKEGLKGGLKGGTRNQQNGFVSTFTEYKAANAKCINVDTETIFVGRPIPYNIADYMQDNFSNEYVRSLGKTISFTFLYYVLASRRALNFILSHTSKLYQKANGNLIVGNIIFLILSGLIFGLFAAASENTQVLAGVMLPFLIIYIVLGIASIVTTITLIFTYIVTFIQFLAYNISSFFDSENIKKPKKDYMITSPLYNIENKCAFNIEDYYVLINDDRFFTSRPEVRDSIYKNPKYILKFIGYYLKSLIIFIFWFVWRLGIIPLVMFIMSMISMLYLHIVIPLKIFYVPLSNPLETFSLLKDHADLLVIFLCLGILSSCYAAFNYKVTGIVGGLIAILIIMKVSKALSKLGL